MEKWLILGLWQGKYKMSLEYLVVPESNEVLKKLKDGAKSKSPESQLKELPMAKAGI